MLISPSKAHTIQKPRYCRLNRLVIVIIILGGLFALSGCVHAPMSNVDNTQIADNRLTLAMAYLERGQSKKALTNLYRAQRAAPHYLPTLMAFAHYYTTVKETERATTTYHKALQHYPHNSQLLHNFAVFLCQQTHYIQAQHYFDKAIKQPYYQNVALSYDSAAQCWWRAREKDKAIRFMQQAVNHAPSRPHMLVRLLRMYIEEDRYEEAEHVYQQHQQLFSRAQQQGWETIFHRHHTTESVLAAQ